MSAQEIPGERPRVHRLVHRARGIDGAVVVGGASVRQKQPPAGAPRHLSPMRS